MLNFPVKVLESDQIHPNQLYSDTRKILTLALSRRSNSNTSTRRTFLSVQLFHFTALVDVSIIGPIPPRGIGMYLSCCQPSLVCRMFLIHFRTKTSPSFVSDSEQRCAAAAGVLSLRQARESNIGWTLWPWVIKAMR